MADQNYLLVTFRRDVTLGSRDFPAKKTTSLPETIARGLGNDVTILGPGPAVPEFSAAEMAYLQGMLDGAVSGPFNARRAAMNGDALIWWPLREQRADAAASITVTDYSGQLSGSLTGGTRRWGPWPGFMGDGATRALMNGGLQGGFTTAARRCGDLSTLRKNEDQITLWAVVHHPNNITGADRAIISYGATQSAKGGWSFGLGGSRERFYTGIYPKNVATPSACRTELPGDKITGSAISPAPAFLNTMTAVALELMADTSGYLIANLFLLPVNADYGIDLKLQSFNSLALVPAGSGGSAAATHDVDAPFCLGARPTTNSTTFTDNINGMGLAQVGIMRHQWKQSIGARIVRDLAAAPREFPLSAAFLLGA